MAAGDTMHGRRVAATEAGWIGHLAPGDYARITNPAHFEAAPGSNGWIGCTPSGMTCALGKHMVVENADGTITVSPSILVTDHRGRRWHGYLENGVWREVA